MTFDSDSYSEMHRLPFRNSGLSEEMADRLLAGRVPAGDAPDPYRGLVLLFETAGAAPVPEETALKGTVVAAAMAALGEATVHSAPHPSQTQISRRRSMVSKLLTAKAAAAATVAALGLGTAAAAATGALPMQTGNGNPHAAAGLAIAASSSSGSNSNGTNGHGNKPSGSNSTGAANNTHAQFGLCTAFMAHHPASTTPASTVPSDSSKTFSALISGHGGLSGTTTYCQGVIAQHNATAGTGDTTTGSDNTSKANDNSNKPSNAGPPSSRPPVSTPDSAGTGTGNPARGGSSDRGTGTADTASGGAGSANSSGH